MWGLWFQSWLADARASPTKGSAVQKLVDHSELSQISVSLTLNDRNDFELLNNTLSSSVSSISSSSSSSNSNSSSTHLNINSKLLSKLDQVQTAVVLSGTIAALFNTSTEFIKAICKITTILVRILCILIYSSARFFGYISRSQTV